MTVAERMTNGESEYDMLINEWTRQMNERGGASYLAPEDESAADRARYLAGRIQRVQARRGELEDLDSEYAEALETERDAGDWRDVVVQRSAVACGVGAVLAGLGVFVGVELAVWGWWLVLAGLVPAGLGVWVLVTLHREGHAAAEWADAQFEATRVYRRRAEVREHCGLAPG